MSDEVEVRETVEEIRELSSDSRGRINFGKDYANQEIRIAILNREDV